MPGMLGATAGSHTTLNQGVTRDLAGMDGQRAQKDAQGIEIHELIHGRQQGKRPSWENEAGAELLRRKLSESIFGHRAEYEPYNAEVARLKAEHGDDAARYARSMLKPGSPKDPKSTILPTRDQSSRLARKQSPKPAVIGARLQALDEARKRRLKP